jgi:hypothetical protein
MRSSAILFAKAYDNGLTDGLGTPLGATYFPLPNWQKPDWAMSQINLNHSFTASIIYQLPFGKSKRFGRGWKRAVECRFRRLGDYADRKSDIWFSGVHRQ